MLSVGVNGPHIKTTDRHAVAESSFAKPQVLCRFPAPHGEWGERRGVGVILVPSVHCCGGRQGSQTSLREHCALQVARLSEQLEASKAGLAKEKERAHRFIVDLKKRLEK